MEISLRGFFADLNASKAVVYFCLLCFTLAFAARLDALILWPWPVVFVPLFVWKMLALLGALCGCISHCRRPPAAHDVHSEIEYRNMIVCAGQHFLLLLFELLICYKLEAGNSTNLQWLLCFVPLIFEAIVAIIVCVWSVRQERSVEVSAARQE